MIKLEILMNVYKHNKDLTLRCLMYQGYFIISYINFLSSASFSVLMCLLLNTLYLTYCARTRIISKD